MSRRTVASGLLAVFAAASSALAFDPVDLDGPQYEQVAVLTSTHDAGVLGGDYKAGWIFDEVRLGGSTFIKGTVPDDEDGAFVNGQVLFDPLWRSFGNVYLDALFRPRPHLGGTVAVGDGTSQAFGGFTWTVPLGSTLFLEASFGGTVHDGDLDDPTDDTQSLGCRVLFRESAGLGVNLGHHWRVLASVDHSSNAGLCDYNDGLSHIGGHMAYRF